MIYQILHHRLVKIMLNYKQSIEMPLKPIEASNNQFQVTGALDNCIQGYQRLDILVHTFLTGR